jgi:hypothetical protein
MTKQLVTALSATAAVVGALLPMTSEAMPAFARQTGKTCLTCHYQNFPILNAYGQEFKAGGYTDSGKQGAIKGPDINLPEVLNSSFLTKLRIQTTNGPGKDGTNGSEYQIPDEFGMLVGGRAAPGIGFMIELSMIGNPALAGYKMPIQVLKTDGGIRATVVPFSTDALGAAYGFELLNTGAVRNVRAFEHRKESSAQQYVGASSGAAHGVAAVVSSADFFVNVSKWAPRHGAAGKAPESTYVRAAWLGNLAGFESGAGVQMWGGRSSTDGTIAGNIDTKATALDFQAQGAVGAMPLGIWASWATAPASTLTSANLFNGSTTNDTKALAVTGQLGVTGHMAAKLGFRSAKNGAGLTDNAITTGVVYHLAQNIGLVAEHSHYSKKAPAANGNALTTLMLESAF